jgi:hypothetical protein
MRFRALGWIVVTSLLALALASPSATSVAARNAPGNNGTVKVHDGAGEPRPEIRNQPHVCTFHLHFFFGDDQQSGSWEIQRWAPGPKGQVVLSGTYDTAGDGEDRQPRQGAYSLPNGHYKLFWDGDTGRHDKQKVFWVKCATPGQPTPTPTPGQPTPTPTPTVAPTADEGTPTPTPTGSVGGETGAPDNTLPPTNTLESPAQPGGNLPVVLLVLLAIGSIAIGATVLRPRSIRTRR